MAYLYVIKVEYITTNRLASVTTWSDNDIDYCFERQLLVLEGKVVLRIAVITFARWIDAGTKMLVIH